MPPLVGGVSGLANHGALAFQLFPTCSNNHLAKYRILQFDKKDRRVHSLGLCLHLFTYSLFSAVYFILFHTQVFVCCCRCYSCIHSDENVKNQRTWKVANHRNSILASEQLNHQPMSGLTMTPPIFYKHRTVTFPLTSAL